MESLRSLPSNNDLTFRVFDFSRDEIPHTGKADEFSIEDYLSEGDNQNTLKQVDAQGAWIVENFYKDEVTLASLRLRAGLSQKTLAEQCGWKQPTIARYETGSTIPSVLAAKKIAKAIGISLDELALAFENSSHRVAR
jgi:ribosome-binding protein aMBF1 (putative translation factor)